MTHSRSIASTSRLLAIVVAACAVLATGGVASAGRKRVVVLELDGPKGEKFHEDLVKLIKKTHTVVPVEKWNGAAEQLAASSLSDRDIKKVARKLKIDAVVAGKIEKRRDEFIIRLRLYEGRSGAAIGDSIDTKAEGPRIDGRAQKDLKDELIGAIDNVETNRVTGGDDEDEPVKLSKKPAETEDEDEKPAKKGKKPAAEEEDEKPAKKGKKPAETEEEDEKPTKKGKKPAAAEDEDEKPAKGKKPAAEDEEDERPARSKFSKRSDDERGGDKVDKKGKKPAVAEDEDDRSARGKKPADEDKPAVKKPDEGKLVASKPAKKPDEDKPVASKPASKPEDEPRKPVRPSKPSSSDDDEDKPAKPGKEVADADDGAPEASDEAEADQAPDAAAALSPGERAVDAVVGLSVTMRRMSFSVSPMLRATPPSYKGIPVAGAIVDATVYPLALGHSRGDQLKNIGLQLVYDRVLKLSSQDPVTKKVYSTIEQRFALTGVFRHAFGKSPTAPVVLGTLGFTRQSFNILGEVDIPDVKYSIIAPGGGVRFPLSAKLLLAADAKFLIVAGTGQIGDPNQYGAASVLGFEAAAGADYMVTRNIFARASLRFETIGFSFKGTGFQTNQRDGMPMTQDVSGARDNYFAGIATVGYVY